MDQFNDSEGITFQVTVGQLTVLTPLPKEHIHVIICVGDMSKITCSGRLAQNGLRVQWNHPFLFSAPPTTSVQIAIWILPKELTPEWDKQPLCDKIITNVASFLDSGNIWRCNVPGWSTGPATLSITCKARNVLLVQDGHDCLSALRKYKTKLYNFGRSSTNMASTLTKIEVELARLDLCPLGHANHASILNDLGIAYSILFDQDGNIAALNRSIELHQMRLNLCPLGHPDHANALGGLAMALGMQYHIQENREDLNRLILIKEAWLALCPLGHPDHAKALGSLAISLRNHYLVEVNENFPDLNKAMEMGETWLKLCPAGYPDHEIALSNLALSMNSHYHMHDDFIDLNRAIDFQERCLKLCPPGHPKHGLTLQNLALSLLDRYHQMKDISDLDTASKLFKEALETYSAHHRYFAFNASQIAATTLLVSTSAEESPLPDQSLPLVDEAFEAYRLLKKCGPAPSLDLLQAAQAWAEDAEKYNHSSALEAYQALLETLDHFTSFSPSLVSRHEAMQGRVADIANDTFSCALRHGDLQMAVEFLEQGRGVLWNQLARLDTSMATLEGCCNGGKELGSKFTRLSAQLRKYAEGTVSQGANPYWRVQEEWQRVVDKIRGLDGFSRFLLPPCFDDLQHAAEGGPVIIVNASKYSCDALIVLHTGLPIHVALPCSLEDVVRLRLQLSDLTQDSKAYGRSRENYLKEILRDLWSSAVEQITTILHNDIQLPPGSRIWWCPTSIFTFFPLHAAGPYREGQKNFMDIYVSSYAPSLSALLRTRDRIRSQREADISGTPDTISFVAVVQARPSADLGLAQLPEVEHEIQRIRNETGMPTEVKFETITWDAATVEGAIQAFRDHHWVHVACYGAQHATKPFDSWFAMGDGKLTLTRIIQERYQNSEFAFLSTSHTAVGDASTPDEALHLTAGLQFAGFNGVIGTLWRVDDAVAHQVVTRFYKEMFTHPNIDFEHAAAALNTAVIETADEVSLEKRIVFVHFGV